MTLLLGYLRDYRKLVFLALGLAAINQIFSLLDPLIFRHVIDEYATRYREYSTGEFFRGVGLLLAAAVGVASLVYRTLAGDDAGQASSLVPLVLGLLAFPVWILKTLFRTIGLVVLAPILAVLGVLALGALLVAGLLALVVPMLPLLIVGLLIWLVVRSFSRRAVPAG